MSAEQHMVIDQKNLQVKLWDLGPREPPLPVKPTVPTSKEGTMQHDLDVIEFRGALATYENELKAYGQAKRDFANWHQTYGGPSEITRYSVYALDALQIEPTRDLLRVNELPNH